jgi:glucosamine 6-phosphate synthetase-like amidotransferase/phosphosugar isomerase protein
LLLLFSVKRNHRYFESFDRHYGVHITIGPEFGVASTKAFTIQVLCLVICALVMCEDRISLQHQKSEIIQGFRQLLYQIRRVLEFDDKVLTIAKEFCTSSVLYLILVALMMCEDKISLQLGRSKIIQGFKQFPVQIRNMLGLDDGVSTIAMGLPFIGLPNFKSLINVPEQNCVPRRWGSQVVMPQPVDWAAQHVQGLCHLLHFG